MYPNKVRRDIAILVPPDVKSVLEIGAGSGRNCVLYPKDAYKVAIEPENREDMQTADKVPGGFNEYHHVLYEDYKEDRKFDLIVTNRDFRYVRVDQGERCYGVLDINHKTFWTKKSFRRFAKENGLEIEQTIGIRKQLKFMPRLLAHSNFLPLQYGFLIKVKDFKPNERHWGM